MIIITLISIGISIMQCANADISTKTEVVKEENSNSGNSEVLYEEIKENYEIYEITKYNIPQYQYFIFDNEHQVLDCGTTERNPPQITNSKGLFKILISAGTGVFRCRYFNVDTKSTSEWFSSPFAESDKLVATLDFTVGATKLIVQDIFDKTKYYHEFEKEFSNLTVPVKSAEFINDNKNICITYETGKDSHEVTEIIDLY